MKKILIIEDEELIYSLLEKKLRQNGYEVRIARYGQEGINKLKNERPDLILLDIVMPGKNGFEVIEEIQKEEKFKNIPIIVISNSGQAAELERAKKMGAKDWLIKTEFDLEEVLAKVKKQIELLEQI